MKKLFIMFIVLPFALIACEKNDAPQEVIDAFNTKYFNIDNVRWEKEGTNIWEAEFRIEGKEMSASFDISGQWVETEIEIRKKDLPKAVIDAIDSNYDKYRIDEVEGYEKPGFSGYRVELENWNKEVTILITDLGVFSEVENEGDDD